MTLESPLRAQADSRILEPSIGQYQGSLFDESADHHSQLLADYRQRYGLAEDPFSDDYSFPLFTGAGRRQVLDRLLHLCQFSSSLLVVMGDYGVGKTRVAHGFMDSLSEHDKLSYLPLKSGQTSRELLAAMVEDLDLGCDGEPTETSLLACLDHMMAVDPLEDDGLAVVVIDNAHLLAGETLQLLADLLQRHPQQTSLHLVLFGEPVLMDNLDRCNLESLLLNDFYLQPFTLAETVDYLNFRMEMADYLGPEIFTESMVNPWWRQAQGQLSIIHQSAQERLLESVVTQTSAPLVSKRNLPVMHILAISGLIALVAVLFLYMDEDSSEQPAAAVSVPAPASAPVASSGVDLTRTDTPVQPIMPSLPATQASQPALAPAPSAEDKVVPLAELPVSSRPQEPAIHVPAPTQVAAPPQPVAVPEHKPQTVPVAAEPKPQPSASKPQAAAAKPVAATAGSAQERTILGWPASHYTIQLLGVSNEKAARDYIAAQPNKADLLMFKSKRQGKDWFVVITGRYPSTVQARQAMASLPSVQREAGPWPREIGAIQQEIRAAQ
ncbi:SPOR domain-containing protein [Cellvibrio japonicus]|uniref:SPOR domain-containing protein n=1 Tax=Cellvibrio japonicus TaxID=155077 RepID=UPI000300AC8E|nr:AAA family ATPase [Cellvibrio japonicus]